MINGEDTVANESDVLDATLKYDDRKVSEIRIYGSYRVYTRTLVVVKCISV